VSLLTYTGEIFWRFFVCKKPASVHKRRISTHLTVAEEVVQGNSMLLQTDSCRLQSFGLAQFLHSELCRQLLAVIINETLESLSCSRDLHDPTTTHVSRPF